MLLSRWALFRAHGPLSRRIALDHLQGGSGLPIKSNVGPFLSPCGHFFITFPRADGSKNICDFCDYDPDGDLNNKSSHAQRKIANIFSNFLRKRTCIASQAMLAPFSRLYFQLFFKEPLAIDASHAVKGGPGFPAPPFRFTGLPVCRSSRQNCPASASSGASGCF